MSKIGTRLLLLGLALTAISHMYSNLLIEAIFPLYQSITTLFDSQIEVTHIGIIQKHNQNFIRVDSILSSQFFIGEHFYFLESTVPCVFLVALDLVLQPAVILYTLILAYPVSTYKDYIVRITFGSLVFIILLAADLPLQIIYQNWVSVEKILKTSGNADGFLSFWSNFSNGGGLVALSLTIGMISIGIANRLHQHRNTVNQ